MSKKKYLVIVESPTKQKTISKMLGPEFIVKSSFGHVRDLPEKDLGVNEKKDFAPTYVIIPNSKKNIADIRNIMDDVETLYLATDPDREGESIAWHLVEALSPDKSKVKRITFHEITPSAIQDSFKQARDIDYALVEAQQARRVLDRLVGYKLSPLLWRKISKGLSAGRVQSVAVRLLVEREQEISDFKTTEFCSLKAKLEKQGEKPQFTSKLVKFSGKNVEKSQTHKLFAEDYTVKTTVFPNKESLSEVVQVLKNNPLVVSKIEKKEKQQRPKPPFITSSLQQDAYSKFGFSAQETMSVAQTLYEGVALGSQTVGLITYMRTDSFNVSKDIQGETSKFINKTYGKEYAPSKAPVYAKKVKGAQEAHEAIHPTSVERIPSEMAKYLDAKQAKLYELIWNRFVASQMEPAVYNYVAVDIAAGNVDDPKAQLRETGRTIKFEGYLKVYLDEKEETDDNDEDDIMFPVLEVGDSLNLINVDIKEHKTKPPSAYNEASLIKTLEKHGIGRPSTYAPIIRTIFDRKYIDRDKKTGRLSPTELGTVVTDKLKGHFPDIMNLTYTASFEEKLDDIAEGSIKWNKVIGEFYNPFMEELKEAYDGMLPVAPKESDELCPVCGGKTLIRSSRFGQYLACARYPDCKGKIRLDKNGKKVVVEQTEEKCNLCGSPMVIRGGRRGKFLACSAFPKCKNTKSLDSSAPSFSPLKSGKFCDKCSKEFLLRHGPKGYFLACSGYPKCKNIISVTDDEVEEIKAKAAAEEEKTGKQSVEK